MPKPFFVRQDAILRRVGNRLPRPIANRPQIIDPPHRPDMSTFSIRDPCFVIVVRLVVAVPGFVAIAGMPIDLFPTINLPQAVVATFYSGMPPQGIEANITAPLERFFTLAASIRWNRIPFLASV
jgi:hypothetical protein